MPDLRFYLRRQWDMKRTRIARELPETFPLQSWLLMSKPHFTRLWTLSPTNSANISTKALNIIWHFQNWAIAYNFKQKSVANKVYPKRLTCQRVLEWKCHWKESKCLLKFFDLCNKNCAHFHWFVNICVISVSKYIFIYFKHFLNL